MYTTGTTENIHTYKLKGWILALNIVSLLVFCAILWLPLVGILAITRLITQAPSEQNSSILFLACLFAPILYRHTGREASRIC